MFDGNLVSSMFIIFTGASIVATIALYTGQAILVSYIILGMLLGPNGIGLITDSQLIDDISHIGIIFLLFLLGLNLHPQSLVRTLGRTAFVTLISSALFAIIGFLIALIFGFSFFESVIIGLSMMFSSTILGLKLLPATVLHHRMMGEIIIGILLLQDLIAIVLLLCFDVSGMGSPSWVVLLKLAIELPGLISIAFLLDHFIINKLFERFDQFKEYIFLLAIGWCLGITEVAHWLGLSHEIGAFIAGITIATSKIALYISENLRPLRDFFLVMFFFALGASFNFEVLPSIIIPAGLIVLVLMYVKPRVYQYLLNRIQDQIKNKDISVRSDEFCYEIGVRLGQLSEFSLLLVFMATQSFQLSEQVFSLVLTATVISFIVSSYWIIKQFPTPLASKDELRRD